MAETPTTATADDKGAELLRLGNKWMERIRAAEKREEDWLKDAEAAEKAYSCDSNSKGEGKLYDFNILHSNVETIVPAIFNSTPVADVRSRNTLPEVQMPDPPQEGQQPTPQAVQQYQMQVKAAQEAQQQIKAVKDFGTMIERAITVQIDDNKLDTEVESAAQDSFLSGRGIVRVRFHADQQGGNERLSYEAVSWRDYRRGPAKRWEDRPWEAFRHSMPREELERFGDPELIQTQTDPAKAVKDDDEDDIIVWEVWCKEPERYVKFIRESDGMIIKKEDDPLGLTDFFPIAKPVQPISLTGNLRPVCPFTVYKKLADELDLCTKRINAIMKGLKVKGAVAGDASDIEALAKADDNELVTIRGALESLAQTKGIEGAIMWWPVQQAIVVLKELYVQREQIKQAIYELTGISDIVRGASNAGETATAQQIKTQWGSLRIQKMQRLIQRLVRDLFIISAEIITTKFSPQTLQTMTGIQITPLIQALMQQKVLAYYRVDVESDSTVKADTQRIKGEMSEFMGGTGQYFSVMAPLVQTDPGMAKPVAQIYSAFARNWNLGKQAEDALEELTNMAEQAGKKPRPNPEQEKLKGEMELKRAEFDMKKQAADQDMAAEREQAAFDRQERMEELNLKREIAGIEKEVKLLDLDVAREKARIAGIQMAQKAAADKASSDLKLDGQRQSNELKAQQAKAKEPAN